MKRCQILKSDIKIVLPQTFILHFERKKLQLLTNKKLEIEKDVLEEGDVEDAVLNRSDGNAVSSSKGRWQEAGKNESHY